MAIHAPRCVRNPGLSISLPDFKRCQMKSSPTTRYPYPWVDLETDLTSGKFSSLTVLAYGSVMNDQSAARTLSRLDHDRTAAVAFGVKRVFNYPMTQAAIDRYAAPISSRHVAALNTIETGNPADTVNGIFRRIAVDDIERFREREKDYNLVPVECLEWCTRQPVKETVYVLVCPTPNEQLLPHLKYLETCERGAGKISAAFLSEFQRSTFLADGRCLADWDRNSD
jgi:hypothetical protein